eukprot:TRINITY_DN6306_c0_g1_i1.p1 TRINITY_DN6306_c0_g1~~TRINITY_DN6306_c0_g1_i1.p1  ORF type:complete len:943 (-),score=313.65 TRINITY_DN6306_c0_g1_i1:182-2773(-)
MPEDFSSLGDESLEGLFRALDKDWNGSISFEEFIRGMITIRLGRQAEEEEEAAMMEQAVLDDAYMEAKEAFEDFADFGYGGEVDFAGFMQALSDPAIVAKVSNATGLPVSWFENLSEADLLDWFGQLDEDSSRTISMHEWLQALVRIRLELYADETSAKEEQAKVLKIAEAAFEEGDEDWSGELDVAEFIRAFKSNPKFVGKIAVAMDMEAEQLREFAGSEANLEELFKGLDKNCSGTISFKEFVDGVVEVRLAQKKNREEEEAVIEEQMLVEAVQGLAQAFEEVAGYSEMDLPTFVEALHNPQLVDKIAEATKMDAGFLQALTPDELIGFFQAIDEDESGTVSIEEWCTTLVRIRQRALQADRAELRAVREASMKAEVAFHDADIDISGDISLSEFLKAFRKNPRFAKSVSDACGLDTELFLSMTDEDLQGFFNELDKDYSGTLDFKEFITGLVETRVMVEAKKQAEAEAAAEARMHSTAAFNDAAADFDGDLTLDVFLLAFRQKPLFVARVAAAAGIDESYLLGLTDQDLSSLFSRLDADFSGGISFEEFWKGLVEIRIDLMREAELAEYLVAEEPSGPAPYTLPEEIQNLKPLDVMQEEAVNLVYSTFDEKELGFIDQSLTTVVNLLQDLCCVVDERAAKMYLERAFPGRDLSWGLQLEDCKVLYQVALDAQPLWSKPLSKSASKAKLRGEDMQGQEDRLRTVFGKHADGKGAMEPQKLQLMLSDMGLMDPKGYSPGYLDSFLSNRADVPVRFPEVVGLCNVTMDDMLGKAPASSVKNTLFESLRMNDELLMRKGWGPSLKPLGASRSTSFLLGDEAAGSPALALRKKKRDAVDFAAKGRAVLASSGTSLGRSSSVPLLF